MIRILFLLLLASGFISAQQADTTETINRFQVGVVYGQMDHEVEFTPSQSVEALRGSEFGLAVRYFDNKLVGIQAELSYAEAGWRETLDSSFATLYERKTTYLEFQILTQFSFGRGAFQPLLQAGPYLSFPLEQKEQIPVEYDPGEPPVPPVYGFDFPFRPNYGLRVGAGLNVELGPVTLQLEGRYLVGFNDLVRTGVTQAATSRRSGIGGHAGLFFAL